MNTPWLLEGSTTMPGSNEYECGECRHRFRLPEGPGRDTRMVMCPACGSIDLNLTYVERSPAAVWTSREGAPAPSRDQDTETLAS
jgi:DNA-directed RNA polymerase subunit RPC12/RpoP